MIFKITKEIILLFDISFEKICFFEKIKIIKKDLII